MNEAAFYAVALLTNVWYMQVNYITGAGFMYGASLLVAWITWERGRVNSGVDRVIPG